MDSTPLQFSALDALLADYLEVEFSFLHTREIAENLARLARDEQDFALSWTRRVASTNVQLAYEFICRANAALASMPKPMIESWCHQVMDDYDRAGLVAAMQLIKDMRGYQEFGHRRAIASVFSTASLVLQPFVQGLSGRRLTLEQSDQTVTDGEIIFLPEMVALFDAPEQNFQLFKAMVVHQWGLARFGTLNIDPAVFAQYADPDKAQAWLHTLETVRTDALISYIFPGLARQMQALKSLADNQCPVQDAHLVELTNLTAVAADSLALLPEYYAQPLSAPICYQGKLDLSMAWQVRQQRLLKDKARFRDALRVMMESSPEEKAQAAATTPLELRTKVPADEWELPQMELLLVDQVQPVPEHVNQLMGSIMLDLTEIPEDYLLPAGAGEYDPALLTDDRQDTADVWAGTYHEEGAFFYDEWDFARNHYRKHWCVVREVEMQPAQSDFYQATLRKYQGAIRSLQRTFEVLRGEDKVLKAQPNGEDVDIDAFVAAWADNHAGLEMTDRLFTQMHKQERNLATIFMVDMSGSTKGWINDAEREALILLVEALEVLGDRYAIYGFSGWARKRCDIYRIKDFDQPLDETVKQAICGIEAKDYTRMGTAIRHFTSILKEVDARTKLLITLSDGKPDDYDHYYRGEYGIEDTRQALFEAQLAGIHPFCITIDKEGADYLPHMYGRANYVVLDEVTRLPLKVADIYRKITS